MAAQFLGGMNCKKRSCYARTYRARYLKYTFQLNVGRKQENPDIFFVSRLQRLTFCEGEGSQLQEFADKRLRSVNPDEVALTYEEANTAPKSGHGALVGCPTITNTRLLHNPECPTQQKPE